MHERFQTSIHSWASECINTNNHIHRSNHPHIGYLHFDSARHVISEADWQVKPWGASWQLSQQGKFTGLKTETRLVNRCLKIYWLNYNLEMQRSKCSSCKTPEFYMWAWKRERMRIITKSINHFYVEETSICYFQKKNKQTNTIVRSNCITAYVCVHMHVNAHM